MALLTNHGPLDVTRNNQIGPLKQLTIFQNLTLQEVSSHDFYLGNQLFSYVNYICATGGLPNQLPQTCFKLT
jgi:hypothetical protein